MKTVLRVSTYPTDVLGAAGRHPYEVSALPTMRTRFIAPALPGKPLPCPANCELRRLSMFLEPRPRNGRLPARLYHLVRRLGSLAWLLLRCLRDLLDRQIDIVHVHSPMYAPIALVGKLFGKHACITYHGSDFYRIRHSRLYAWLARRFDTVFCISSAMQAELERIHAKPVHVVVNGIDREFYRNDGSPRQRRILAVGTFKEEKGFDILLRAFHLAVTEQLIDPAYQLVIAGDGRLAAELQALTDELGLTGQVHFPGRLAPADLVAEYNRCEVFVLSSISEGFPKVVLEAMSCGCRVVATEVGEVPRIFGPDYPCLAPPGDSKALAVAIGVAAAYPKMVAGYDDILKRYTWDAVREQYNRILNREHG